MAEAPQTSHSGVIQVGSDRITIQEDNVLIETRRPMLDWKVREFNPVPIYFEDRKYLLAQKLPGQTPFVARYWLKPWPPQLVSNTTKFHTYDSQTVAERDREFRSEKASRVIFLLLLPFYPFLGLLWSPMQDRLAYVGFAPSTMTRISIGTEFMVIIPAMILLFTLGSISVMTLLLVVIITGLVDAFMRSHLSLKYESWRGGFLEWLFPTTSEFPPQREIKTPGFLASLEALIWGGLDEVADSRSRRSSKQAFKLPPIIERELQVALRREKPFRRRFRLATACTGVALLLSIFAGQSAGRDFHLLLCLAAFFIVLSVPKRIAGFLSAERREQTLGLLFISGLSPSEIFLSKTISAAAVVFSDFLAIMPLVALPFLMGGVTFELFIATIFCWPSLLLFALSISLLASVLCEDEGTAMIFAAVLGIGLSAFPPLIYLAQKFLSNGTQAWDWLLLCNPAFGAWLLFGKFSLAQATAFWQNIIITLFGSTLCLIIAGYLLKRLWRQREERGVVHRWKAHWQSAVHGGGSWRQRLAQEWLFKSPSMWLAARDRAPIRLAWVVLGTIILIWLICWAVWLNNWLSVANLLITASVLNLALRWLIHYVAAAGTGLRRKDGHFDLLLTTPIRPAEIVEGQLTALRFQFRKISLLLFGLEIGMMVVGLTLRTWDFRSLSAYLGLWSILFLWEWQQSWNFRRTALSMWAGLNSARPVQVVWRVTGFNAWLWIWLLFSLRQGVNGVPSGSFPELLFISVAGFIVFELFLQSKLENQVLLRRLDAEFREIVREPIPDPRDSRFKQWNVRERFPWGWSLVQSQLHERLVRRQGA